MEPFKNLFNPDVIRAMARSLERSWADFPRAKFEQIALDGLEELELKARSEQIVKALEATLPDDFAAATPVLLEALHPHTDGFDRADPEAMDHGVNGWAIMPMTEYVGRHGQQHFELALEIERELTKRFSSEFGIRHLIAADPQRAVAVFRGWTNDPNEHVRRLVSEGTRPRLPWGIRLQCFIAEPEMCLPLLEALRDDPSEYVRRSVANHLNDIAKDHPDLVVKIARDWWKKAPAPRKKLLRHALRTLLKQGHSGALELMGHRAASWDDVQLEILTPTVRVGDKLGFRFRGKLAEPLDSLRLDYTVHYLKANGQLSPKVFRWKVESNVPAGAWVGERQHSFKVVTTRRYYPGPHELDIIANGQVVARAKFELEE
ncbi:MAG: DNA alkylation repair protein [Verrucomicrobiota bacterium JB022]|nr:DNA alkylation repair protein [Verrucomicrobiota bacterium JB022]